MSTPVNVEVMHVTSGEWQLHDRLSPRRARQRARELSIHQRYFARITDLWGRVIANEDEVDR